MWANGLCPNAIHSEMHPVYGDKCLTRLAIHVWCKKLAEKFALAMEVQSAVRQWLYQLHVACFIQLSIPSQSTCHQWRITSVLVTLQTVCWRHVSHVLEGVDLYAGLEFWTFFSASKSGGRLICGSPYTREYTVVTYLHIFITCIAWPSRLSISLVIDILISWLIGLMNSSNSSHWSTVMCYFDW